MRLLLTAVTCQKSDVDANLARHLQLLEEGRDRGCDLVLLPEMSLTGSATGAACDLNAGAVAELVRATGDPGPALCFGLVEAGPAGTAPYITQVVAARGGIQGVHRKAGLGEDEDGTYRPGPPAEPVAVSGWACSFAVCAEIGTAPPYDVAAALVLGPSAPGLYGPRRASDADWRRGFAWWRGSVLADAARLLGPGRWLAVSTQCGATVDEDFPGWAALVAPGGTVVDELPDWREGTLVVDVPALTRA